MKTTAINGRILSAFLALCMILSVCCGMSEAMFASAAEISSNAMELDESKVADVVVSYIDGDNWIDVTEETNTSLPADTSYQLTVQYHNISVQELKDADYQMIYEGLPDWFMMSGSGILWDGDTAAASIEQIDGKVVITFDKAWVDARGGNSVLNGSFNLYGYIDWRNLPADPSDRRFPGLDLNLNFEEDAAQKYGIVGIEKSEPVLEEGADGNYYLAYEITVSSQEIIDMPDITVRDLFGNLSYISGYVGIDSGVGGNAAMMPTVDGNAVEDIAGTFSRDPDGSMVWNIGTLPAGETRTLKYYAQISDSYIDPVLGNPIQNRADVYSGSYRKDTDASGFVPQTGVLLEKRAQDVKIEQNGNGYITYTVTVQADDTNSFTLKDLEFKDAYPEELAPYVTGDLGDTITVSVTQRGTTTDYEVPYGNASFMLPDVTLLPGEEITIEYKILTKNIFLYNNGEVELNNTATIGKGDRILSRSSDQKTLQRINTVRKIYGAQTAQDETITFDPDDAVYELYQGNVIEEIDGDGFDVPAGSHMYDVVLNESGNWDLSSITIKDNFTEKEHIRYIGYVQIRLYQRVQDDAEPYDGSLSNGELLNALDDPAQYSAVRTVWLRVDGLNAFSFLPSDLGIDSETYTYRLTYYADTVDMENVASLQLTNEFELEAGTIGDGNGGRYPFPGSKVSVGHTVQGGVKYDADKVSWYYEKQDDLYRTDAVGKRDYNESTWKNDYTRGAIYWVIRLTGDIKPGHVDASANGYGFVVGDVPASGTANGSKFVRDSLVGVFCGPKSVYPTQYGSYAEFLAAELSEEQGDDGRFQKLIGNPGNDWYFSDYFDPSQGAAQYKWYASNTEIKSIVFPDGYELDDDEALYIVLRTIPDALPSGDTAYKSYRNDLKIGLSKDEETPAKTEVADTAYYTLQVKGALYKESKGAYIFNKSKGTFVNCSNKSGGDWKIETVVGTENLDSSGTYAAWLLNVNWDGSMSGDAYVSDYLPEGMELEYADVNNFGPAIANGMTTAPKTGYIEDLQHDPDWRELTHTRAIKVNSINNTPVTAITYYNPSTREIRWYISGLTGAANVFNSYEINFCLICRVTDPELFLSGQGKTYYNEAAILDGETLEPIYMETADVTITRAIDKTLDETVLADIYHAEKSGNSYNGKVNRIPFKMEINPLGEDMSDTDLLPALIDELGEKLEVLENTIKVLKADGTEYTAFTYTVTKDPTTGCQTLIIKDLPDSTPLTITYDLRINASPGVSVAVSNKAYWAGNPPPDAPQVGGIEFKYEPSGDVFESNHICVELSKVDSASHSKRLQGAVFALYKSDETGELIEQLSTGTTDSYGIVQFKNPESGAAVLLFDQIYCIKELTAPNGYKLDTKNNADLHYFVIVSPNSAVPETSFDLKVWYDSPDPAYSYSLVVENEKGTIRVEKQFQYENGTVYQPESGRYQFGLFDGSGVLMQTLTIEYTKQGVRYDLDGVPCNQPEFTRFEPSAGYEVYELDGAGNPVKEGDTFFNGDTLFKVSYGTDGSNTVYADSTVEIGNRETAGVSLPETGGSGVKIYYAAGALLVLMSLAAISSRSVRMRKKQSG